MLIKFHFKMDWKCNWATYTSNLLPLLFYVLVLMMPPVKASNNACDWTGSGLSASYQEREIVSIYLRCTAGKIVWNYPKGAIRVLLRSPMGLQSNFRACLKVHQFVPHFQKAINPNSTDLNQNNKIARIFLEAPKRLIALYDDDDRQIVKCFRSINEQVALYVEAEETTFENLQTTFEYNLEFINNKHHSIRPLTPIAETQLSDNGKILNGHKFNKTTIEIDADDDDDGTWWWWRWGRGNNNKKDKKRLKDDEEINAKHKVATYDEDILGSLGESWEICRPCTEAEMAHAYCSGDIVTRGTIFNVQEQPHLNTIEITVKRTKILRNNIAIMDAEEAWRHYYKTNKQKISKKQHRRKNVNTKTNNTQFKFHTPTHCSASHGEGEFVFMGRRRFEEVMLICAPRLDEWAYIARRLNETNSAPCVLRS